MNSNFKEVKEEIKSNKNNNLIIKNSNNKIFKETVFEKAGATSDYAKLIFDLYKDSRQYDENKVDKILNLILSSNDLEELYKEAIKLYIEKNKNKNLIIEMIKDEKIDIKPKEEKNKNYIIGKIFINYCKNYNLSINLKIINHNSNIKERIKEKLKSNIHFKIGQPDTGKSFSFEEKILFPEGENDKDYKYFKMSVTGGLTGLDQRDISISTDPKTKETVISKFVWLILSAIINPTIPHVVFFDDFHNTNISQLFSNFMPLLKKQNIKDLKDLEDKNKHPDFDFESEINKIVNKYYENINDFISDWNEFIKKLKYIYDKKGEILSVNSIINPNDTNYNLDLVFPKNFYILGAANWNQNTNHIFADMENRAFIEKIKPILEIEKLDPEIIKNSEEENKKFLEFILSINNSLKEILKKDNIFDYEQYCFGIFKIINNGKIEIEDKEETIKYFFRMIKNSLIEKGKSTEVNKIGFLLLKDIAKNASDSIAEIDIIKNIRENKIIKDNNELDENCKEIYEILHELGIYSE